MRLHQLLSFLMLGACVPRQPTCSEPSVVDQIVSDIQINKLLEMRTRALVTPANIEIDPVYVRIKRQIEDLNGEIIQLQRKCTAIDIGEFLDPFSDLCNSLSYGGVSGVVGIIGTDISDGPLIENERQRYYQTYIMPKQVDLKTLESQMNDIQKNFTIQQEEKWSKKWSDTVYKIERFYVKDKNEKNRIKKCVGILSAKLIGYGKTSINLEYVIKIHNEKISLQSINII